MRFCSPARWILILGFFFIFFLTHHPQKMIMNHKSAHYRCVIFSTTISVVFNRSHCHLMYIIFFCYTEKPANSVSRCLPAWPVPLLSRKLILKRVGERESLCHVCLNSAKEHIVRPICLHVCVCAVQVRGYQTLLFHHELKRGESFFPLTRFLHFNIVA